MREIAHLDPPQTIEHLHVHVQHFFIALESKRKRKEPRARKLAYRILPRKKKKKMTVSRAE